MITRTPMKKTQLGSRDLLANGGGCPVEVSHRYFYDGFYNELHLFFKKVFCRLRPPKETSNDQQLDNSSSCIKVASSTELVLYSSEVSQFVFLFNLTEYFTSVEC